MGRLGIDLVAKAASLAGIVGSSPRSASLELPHEEEDASDAEADVEISLGGHPTDGSFSKRHVPNP